MAKLLAGIIIAVFMGLTLGVANEEAIREKRDIRMAGNTEEFFQSLCADPIAAQFLSFWCNSYTTTTTTQSTTSTTNGYGSGSSQSSSPSTPSVVGTTTKAPSVLEQAHWCHFSNGSYLALGQSFMYSECTLCRCLQSRVISCTALKCMPTFCVDNTLASRRTGQCCSQCAYENTSTTCVINGLTVPNGAVVRETSDNVQCWCQLGSIECRKVSTTLFASLDYWGRGTAVYVIVIVICIILILGSLLCLGGGLFFYYYYKQDKVATQQAYEHYYNSAGWQPMGDDGQVADPNAEAKQAEAEAGAEGEQEQYEYEYEYPTGNSEQYIPPPYALYNGSYINDQPEKEPKL